MSLSTKNPSSAYRFWLIFKVHLSNKSALVPSNVLAPVPIKVMGKCRGVNIVIYLGAFVLLAAVGLSLKEPPFFVVLPDLNERWLPAVFDR